MKKRYCFTFLEILLALSLLTLLITALFSGLKFLTYEKSMSTSKREALEERYADQRLLKRLVYAKLSPFFTSDGALFFTIDHEPHRIPELSGEVLASLYHDPASKTLCLKMWPHGKQTPSQNQIILDKVEKCAFSFYYPPQDEIDPDPVGAIQPPKGWNDAWSKEYSCLPALMKIIVTRTDREATVYCYELYNSPLMVTE